MTPLTSSLTMAANTPEHLATYVRGRWSIEHTLSRDITFREDASQVKVWSRPVSSHLAKIIAGSETPRPHPGWCR